MIGKHHVIVETKRLKYEFDIKRNITVILGDSATGKTTLVEMLSTYSRIPMKTGIRVESDVPCVVFSDFGSDWAAALRLIENSIVFIDEDYPFVFSQDFAELVSGSSNYFVIITRRPLYNLPYSINEVYGIRTSGKYHYPEQIYHEFYNIYQDVDIEPLDKKYTFYIEDSKSGFEFYRNAFGDSICRSCEGNSQVAKKINSAEEDNIAVIADGAAFGAFMEDLLGVIDDKQRVILYLPESFEWLILRSGIVKIDGLDEILSRPEDHIRSEEYLSWERFFTALLQHATEMDPVSKYSKLKLQPFYYSGRNKQAILDVMPEEIKKLALGEE